MKLLAIMAVAVLLFGAVFHFTNYAFANEHLTSQMNTAHAAAMAGMKKVMGSVQSGGVHAGVQTAKNVMGSALHGTLNSTGNTQMTKAAKKDTVSQIRTADVTAKKGMKEVKDSIKSGGLQAGVQTAKNVMGSALSGEYGTTATEQSTITSELASDINQIEISSENFGNEIFSFLDTIVKEIHN